MHPVIPHDYGLEWIEEDDGIFASWCIEPDLESIKELLASSSHLSAKYLPVPFAPSDQGGRNKLYSLELDEAGDTVDSCSDGQGKVSLVLRVSLPIDMPRKVASEVATMMFLSENTVSIRILAFCESCCHRYCVAEATHSYHRQYRSPALSCVTPLTGTHYVSPTSSWRGLPGLLGETRGEGSALRRR